MSDMKKGALGKLRLCDAIRKGCGFNKKASGTFKNTDGSTCVQGAALEAAGFRLIPTVAYIFDPDVKNIKERAELYKTLMHKQWPYLSTSVSCPVCGIKKDLRATLAHLNNEGNGNHNWTREAIADWIEREFESEIPERDLTTHARLTRGDMSLAGNSEKEPSQKEPKEAVCTS